MAGELNGEKVAFLMANEGVEQVELTEPIKAVEGAEGVPVLIAPKSGEIQAFNHLDRADVFSATLGSADASPDAYRGLVLPGGVANPDQLRMDDASVALVRSFFESGKPVAAICHAPWTLVEADVVRGRVLTSWPSLQTDIRNAGGDWVDEEVVVCENGPNELVTSRRPHDLPAFTAQLVKTFATSQ